MNYFLCLTIFQITHFKFFELAEMEKLLTHAELGKATAAERIKPNLVGQDQSPTTEINKDVMEHPPLNPQVKGTNNKQSSLEEPPVVAPISTSPSTIATADQKPLGDHLSRVETEQSALDDSHIKAGNDLANIPSTSTTPYADNEDPRDVGKTKLPTVILDKAIHRNEPIAVETSPQSAVVKGDTESKISQSIHSSENDKPANGQRRIELPSTPVALRDISASDEDHVPPVEGRNSNAHNELNTPEKSSISPSDEVRERLPTPTPTPAGSVSSKQPDSDQEEESLGHRDNRVALVEGKHSSADNESNTSDENRISPSDEDRERLPTPTRTPAGSVSSNQLDSYQEHELPAQRDNRAPRAEWIDSLLPALKASSTSIGTDRAPINDANDVSKTRPTPPPTPIGSVSSIEPDQDQSEEMSASVENAVPLAEEFKNKVPASRTPSTSDKPALELATTPGNVTTPPNETTHLVEVSSASSEESVLPEAEALAHERSSVDAPTSEPPISSKETRSNAEELHEPPTPNTVPTESDDGVGNTQASSAVPVTSNKPEIDEQIDTDKLTQPTASAPLEKASHSENHPNAVDETVSVPRTSIPSMSDTESKSLLAGFKESLQKSHPKGSSSSKECEKKSSDPRSGEEASSKPPAAAIPSVLINKPDDRNTIISPDEDTHPEKTPARAALHAFLSPIPDDHDHDDRGSTTSGETFGSSLWSASDNDEHSSSAGTSAQSDDLTPDKIGELTVPPNEATPQTVSNPEAVDKNSTMPPTIATEAAKSLDKKKLSEVDIAHIDKANPFGNEL